MAQIELVFPFSVEEMSPETRLDVPLERNQAFVSFALPYELNLSIPNAEFAKKAYKGASVIYVFEFDSLDQALGWMDDPMVYVEYRPRNGDVKVIEEEMDEYMRKYETRERAAKRKRMVEDEEGFVHYE